MRHRADFVHGLLGFLLREQVTTLAPGQTADTNWWSLMDTPFGVHALRTVNFQANGSHDALLNPVGVPGTYVVTAVYEFADQASAGDIFAGKTNEASVQFVVSP